MSLLAGLFALWALLIPSTAQKVAEMTWDCPEQMGEAQVCVFRQDNSIIAVNPTAEPVKVVLKIERIENVVLTYRYPFVEQLKPNSSRVLLEYRLVKENAPFALDFQWAQARN